MNGLHIILLGLGLTVYAIFDLMGYIHKLLLEGFPLLPFEYIIKYLPISILNYWVQSSI